MSARPLPISTMVPRTASTDRRLPVLAHSRLTALEMASTESPSQTVPLQRISLVPSMAYIMCLLRSSESENASSRAVMMTHWSGWRSTSDIRAATSSRSGTVIGRTFGGAMSTGVSCRKSNIVIGACLTCSITRTRRFRHFVRMVAKARPKWSTLALVSSTGHPQGGQGASPVSSTSIRPSSPYIPVSRKRTGSDETLPASSRLFLARATTPGVATRSSMIVAPFYFHIPLKSYFDYII